MAKDKQPESELVPARLTALWRRELPKLPLGGARYALLGDTHLGDGKGADAP